MERLLRIVTGIAVILVPVCLILLRLTFGLVLTPEMRFMPTESNLMALGEEMRSLFSGTLARQPLLLPQDMAGGEDATRIRFRWRQGEGVGGFSAGIPDELRDSLRTHFAGVGTGDSLAGSHHLIGYELSAAGRWWLVNGVLDTSQEAWVFSGYLTDRAAFFRLYARRWFDQWRDENPSGWRFGKWTDLPIAVILSDDRDGAVTALWQGAPPEEGKPPAFDHPFDLFFVPNATVVVRSGYLATRSYKSFANQLLAVGLIAWFSALVLIYRKPKKDREHAHLPLEE